MAKQKMTIHISEHQDVNSLDFLIDGLNPSSAYCERNPALLTWYPKSFILNVRVPTSTGFPVRVGNVIPESRFPTGYLANLRHPESLTTIIHFYTHY